MVQKVLRKGVKAKAEDFDGPKAAKSAYMLYADEVRPKFLAELQAAGIEKKKTIEEVAKKVGEAWKTIDADKKAELEKKSNALKAKYEAALEKWKQTEKYKEFQAAKLSFKKNKSKNEAKKALVDAGQPKQPVAPYLKFSGEVSKSVIEDLTKKLGKMPDMKERTVEAQARWAKLSEDEKKKYETEYKAAKEKYTKDMETFKMSDAYKKIEEAKQAEKDKTKEAKDKIKMKAQKEKEKVKKEAQKEKEKIKKDKAAAKKIVDAEKKKESAKKEAEKKKGSAKKRPAEAKETSAKKRKLSNKKAGAEDTENPN